MISLTLAALIAWFMAIAKHTSDPPVGWFYYMAFLITLNIFVGGWVLSQ